jgi:hypothetical protein
MCFKAYDSMFGMISTDYNLYIWGHGYLSFTSGSEDPHTPTQVMFA